MCADIEIVTPNQYDGASAAHAELDGASTRIWATLEGSHVRIDGTSSTTDCGGGAGSSRWRSGPALSPDLLLDGSTRTSRIAAHGVRWQAERSQRSVSRFKIRHAYR